MKNMKIIAILAVLLAAALFVGAASAANSTTIFVDEQIDQTLITRINGDKEAESIDLYKLSDSNPPSILDRIILTKDSRLLSSNIGNNTGVWYTNTDKNTANTVYIYYPKITLSAELVGSPGDSIDDGKTISTNTPIHFIIDSPRLADVNITGGVSKDDKTLSQVKIVFTTPVGGKTSVFGYKSDSTQNVANNKLNFDAITLSKGRTITENVVAGTDAVAGTWTAQAVFIKPDTFKNYASKSNTIRFNLQSTALTLVTPKESIIRNNPFTVTISGDSHKKYAVFLEDIDTNEVNYPYIPKGQNGCKYYVSEEVCGYKVLNKNGHYTAAVFETDASGKSVIQFNTEASTEDKTYTVRVAEIASQDEKSSPVTNVEKLNGGDYDTVNVKVEKGGVTITASGDGHYHIGSEITLSGTNTDSDNIYLFITGPNIDENGVTLKTVGNENIPAYKNVQPVKVKTDKTWEYNWDTSKSGLDTGSYTIYATSVVTNGKSSRPIENGGNTVVKLSDSEYADVLISLKQPSLSATTSGTIVAKGDNIYIRGIAKGEPSKLQYYIFGPNKFDTGSISVKDDGSYEKKLTIGSNWASNQYYVVIEHPMNNGEIDVHDSGIVSGKRTLYIKDAYGNNNTQSSFIVEGQGRLQSLDALNALTKMINSTNIDDIYKELTFTVAEPWIKITNPGDKALGSKFTISGTTNLAVDDQILVEVMSSSFSAVDKKTIKVVAGEGTDNTWSVEIDTTNWKLDKYTVKVNGIEVDVTATTNFNLVEKIVNLTPTVTSTSAPANKTANATATATPTPATPGFGAFITLAGLGAVALLVLRRN